MTGNHSRQAVTATILAAFLAAVLFAPVSARALSSADDDDDDAAVPMIVSGDFNRDGIADMARASSPEGNSAASSTLAVLLGQPDGSYKQAPWSPALGHDPRSLVVGDFNHDGIPDLIVGDADGSLLELVGDGSGRMTPASEVAHLDSAASIAVADFNHDGQLDMAVSDPRASSVTVLLGTGNGSFRHGWTFPLEPGIVARIATADFNGDGLPDLIVTIRGDDSFEVMLGNGNGTFTSSQEYSTVKNPYSHCNT